MGNFERRKIVIDYEKKLRSRRDKLSWLEAGRSRVLKQKDKKISRKEARRLQREFESLVVGNSTPPLLTKETPQISKWTLTRDHRISGWISDSSGGPYKTGTKITTSKIKGRSIKPGMTVNTLSGSQYRLGLNVADSNPKQVMKRDSQQAVFPISPIGLMDFFKRDIPSLTEWNQDESGTLTGFVLNKEGLVDGTQITTSRVKTKDARAGMIVETECGSKYKLLRQKIS